MKIKYLAVAGLCVSLLLSFAALAQSTPPALPPGDPDITGTCSDCDYDSSGEQWGDIARSIFAGAVPPHDTTVQRVLIIGGDGSAFEQLLGRDFADHSSIIPYSSPFVWAPNTPGGPLSPFIRQDGN